jgi:tetratricopeptide (TPR) repeat protein
MVNPGPYIEVKKGEVDDMSEISINSENDEMQELFRKAKALRKNSHYEEAILCYDKILEINPTDVNILSALASCYFYLSRWEAAYRCYVKIHGLEPDNASPLLNMAQSLLMVDRLHEALECFDKVAVLRPNDSDIWNSRGILLLELARIKESLEFFKHAIVLFPKIDNYNSAYLDDEHHQKAMECLEKFVRMPSTPKRLLKAAEEAKKHIENRRTLMIRCAESRYASPSDQTA